MRDRVLFITTKRDNYHNEVCAEIRNRGYDVDRYFDYPRGVFVRAVAFLFPRTWGFFVKRYYDGLLRKARGRQYGILFVLRGFRLPEFFMVRLKEENPGLRCVMYQWDSIRNHDYRYLMKHFDRVYSFDREDVRAFEGLKYLPLFYSPVFSAGRRYDVCFIGGSHGDRQALLDQVAENLERNGLSYYFYLYEPLPMQVRNLLKARGAGGAPRSGKVRKRMIRMSPSRVSGIMRNSRVILDINSPFQSGLTIRQIEAVGLGLRTMTTNHSVREESIYRDDYFLIIDRNGLAEEDIVDFCRKSVNPIPGAGEYSLSSWVNSILETE